MQDRTIKTLSALITVLLAGLVLRPLLQPTVVQAQGVSRAAATAREDAVAQAIANPQGTPLPVTPHRIPTGTGSAQMLVDKDNIALYVLLDGKVYVYSRVDDVRWRWVLWQTLDPVHDTPQRAK